MYGWQGSGCRYNQLTFSYSIGPHTRLINVVYDMSHSTNTTPSLTTLECAWIYVVYMYHMNSWHFRLDADIKAKGISMERRNFKTSVYMQACHELDFENALHNH